MTHEDLGIAITDGVAVVTLDRPAERNAFSGAMTRSPARIGGAKALQAKPADLAKCQAKSDLKLSKLNGVASAAALPCRYGDNGDGTVTDSDTGLQWERKTDDFTYHDKDNTFTWSPSNNEPDGTVFTILLGLLNRGTSGDGSTTSGCFAGHCDWRLPAIGELAGIVDLGASGCGSVSPCIDETVFGPTTASLYWSATTDDLPSAAAWVVDFDDGASGSGLKAAPSYARAVRSHL